MDTELLELTVVKLTLGLVMGLILGSFTTMLSYRVPRKLSIVSPPSKCPTCETRLTVRDLVPVLSWILGKGRCRHCSQPIGLRYLMIELITALLVMAAFVVIGINPTLVAALLGIIALVALVTINLERR